MKKANYLIFNSIWKGKDKVKLNDPCDSMLNNWLSGLEQLTKYLEVRVCFLDFSKAFDHIYHII